MPGVVLVDMPTGEAARVRPAVGESAALAAQEVELLDHWIAPVVWNGR